MIIDPFPTICLAAAASPGSVVAPSWLLPTAAAVTGLIPACMIPLVKGMEKDKVAWETLAPQPSESLIATKPDAFAVLEAGAKGMGLFATCHVPSGTFLFHYTGEPLTQTEYDQRYPSKVSDYCAGTPSETHERASAPSDR
jgi:hypothetical protein